jgi:membrane-bound serine protease (ClpP class)
VKADWDIILEEMIRNAHRAHSKLESLIHMLLTGSTSEDIMLSIRGGINGRKTWMRRLLSALIVMIFMPGGAQAAPNAQAAVPQVIVLTAKGPVVPPFADYINRGIDQANRDHAEVVILTLDTPGGALGITLDLMQKIRNSEVPIVVFVGPRGAKAASAGLLITLAGDASAMAPDTAIGASTPITSNGGDLDSDERKKTIEYLSAQARSLTEARGEEAAQIADDAIRNARAVTANEAAEAKLIDFIAEDVDEVVKKLDGFEIAVKGGKRTLNTADAQVVNVAMTPVEGLLLYVSDILTIPNVVFILLATGVILIIIEVSQPGGWVLGTAGVISLGMALYGMGILPVNWLGLVFVGLAFVLYFLDIRAPTHGILTAAATVSLIAGAVILFGTPEIAPYGELSIPLVIGVSVVLAGMFLALIMLAFRTIHHKPSTGKEGLIAQVGLVMRDIDPVGSVRIQGEIWQAESADGKAIPNGTNVQVVEIEGMRLRVRPEV